MKRDDEYHMGFRAGWLHAKAYGRPVPPATPVLPPGESYYVEGFQAGVCRAREQGLKPASS